MKMLTSWVPKFELERCAWLRWNQHPRLVSVWILKAVVLGVILNFSLTSWYHSPMPRNNRFHLRTTVSITTRSSSLPTKFCKQRKCIMHLHSKNFLLPSISSSLPPFLPPLSILVTSSLHLSPFLHSFFSVPLSVFLPSSSISLPASIPLRFSLRLSPSHTFGKFVLMVNDDLALIWACNDWRWILYFEILYVHQKRVERLVWYFRRCKSFWQGSDNLRRTGEIRFFYHNGRSSVDRPLQNFRSYV